MPSSSFSTPYSLEIDLLRSDTRGIFMLPRPPCFLGVLTLKREREKKPKNKQTFFIYFFIINKYKTRNVHREGLLVDKPCVCPATPSTL